VGQLVEVLAVDVDEVGKGSALLGANVDSPAVGRRMAASGVEISGWALAASGRPEAVEVALGGEALGRGIWHPREDLASAFPETAAATEAGFEVAVDVAGAPERAELEVAVEVGGARLPIARLRLRRFWRGELGRGRPPLVSLAIVAEAGEEEALARTLASVGRQRHPATEVLVARPAGAGSLAGPDWERSGIREVAGRDGPDLRNEAIRQSNGELILFLAAGSALAADALPLAIEMLTRKPAASAVVDGGRGGVAAAIYRRSAFEELEGFGGQGADCDRELATRAERRGALFSPGVLVPVGG